MKLLVDMNLSPNWVAELRSRGIESIHWSGLGSASAVDEEILAWCASHDHVLFTNDLDFGAIPAASKDRTPSVVQMRTEDVTPQTMVFGPLLAGLAALGIAFIIPPTFTASILPP